MIIDSDIDSSAYNCICVLLAIAARNMGCSYEMIGKGTWTFDYDTGADGMIGDRMDAKQKGDPYEFLDKYHNIVVERYQYNEQDFNTKVRNILSQNYLVIINTDSFYCKWSMAYDKRHYLHSFMIVDYNDMEKQYISIDPYLTSDEIRVDSESIASGIRDYMIVKKKGEIAYQPSSEELLASLNEEIIKIMQNDGGMFRAIADFALDLESIDIKAECRKNEDNLYAVPLLANLRIIMSNRRNFSYMLRYIARTTKRADLVEFADRLYLVSNRWEVVRSKLFLLFSRYNQKIQQSIADEVVRISQEERLIAKQICGCICSY